MKTLAGFLLALLISCQVQAQQVPIKLVAINGPFAVSDAEVFELWKAAQLRLKDAGKTFKLIRYQRRQDPCAHLSRLSDMKAKHRCLETKLQTSRRPYLTYAILPPVIENGTSWIGGYASTICAGWWAKERFASGNAIINRFPDGQSRFNHSAVIMAHELGHLLGAEHDDSLPPSLMHSNALPFVSELGILHFSPNSLSQLSRNCLPQRARNKRKLFRCSHELT